MYAFADELDRWLGASPAATVLPERPHRVAVLPFAVAEPNGNALVADAMTEALITHLSCSPRLRVVSKTSTERFRGRTDSLRQIGRKLKVGTLVEGAIVNRQQRVLVSARVIEAATDAVQWTAEHEIPDNGLLRIAEALADAMIQRICARDTNRHPRATMLTAPAAYQQYVRARVLVDHGDARAFDEARDLLVAVIAAEPEFAPPYATLAVYWMLAAGRYLIPREQAVARASRLVATSLELSPLLAEAHSALGMVRLLQMDVADAGIHHRTCVELSPGYWTGHTRLANYLTILGRFDEAGHHVLQARRIDPSAKSVTFASARRLFIAREFTAALPEWEFFEQMCPGYFLALHRKGLCELALGRHAAAEQSLRRAYQQAPLPYIGAALTCVLAQTGRRDWALELRRELEAASVGNGGRDAIYLAEIAVHLGEIDRALDLIDAAITARSPDFPALVEPLFDVVRSHPRVRAALRRSGLRDERDRSAWVDR